MEVTVVASLVALTSLCGYLVGRRGMGLPRAVLVHAVREMLECLALGLVFAGANLLSGTVLLLLFRETTGVFVTPYLATDITLIILALFQGIVFSRWIRLGARNGAAERGSEVRARLSCR